MTVSWEGPWRSCAQIAKGQTKGKVAPACPLPNSANILGGARSAGGKAPLLHQTHKTSVSFRLLCTPALGYSKFDQIMQPMMVL